MSSHIPDITKSKATPLCGSESGVCVDSEQALCVECHRARVALYGAEAASEGLEGVEAYLAYLKLKLSVQRLLTALAMEWL